MPIPSVVSLKRDARRYGRISKGFETKQSLNIRLDKTYLQKWYYAGLQPDRQEKTFNASASHNRTTLDVSVRRKEEFRGGCLRVKNRAVDLLESRIIWVKKGQKMSKGQKLIR